MSARTSRPKPRRIAIIRDGWGRLVGAWDAQSGKKVPVAPEAGAIKVGRKWYVLASAAKEIAFPRDILTP